MSVKSGDVYRVGRAASVQFGPRPIWFRVIRQHDWPTYDGWVWVDGYELNPSTGEAVQRRSILVLRDGLVRRAAPWPVRRRLG